jgi:hypothetical protein
MPIYATMNYILSSVISAHKVNLHFSTNFKASEKHFVLSRAILHLCAVPEVIIIARFFTKNFKPSGLKGTDMNAVFHFYCFIYE